MTRFSLARLLCFLAFPAAAEEDFPAPPVVGIPFGCGRSFAVSQVHAVGTHVENDVWAWDFRMPEGTPVVAALAGVVRLARGDSTEGGCDRSLASTANYVVLEHAGGVETQYLHFSRVVVEPGQHVQQGELLGYSGATGWACGPHLHFKVARPVNDGWNNPSITARIVGYGDPPLGTQVTSAACPAPAPLLAGDSAASTATSSAMGSAVPGTAPARVGGALLPGALGSGASGPGPATAPSHAGSGGPVQVTPAHDRAPPRPSSPAPGMSGATQPRAPSPGPVHAAG